MEIKAFVFFSPLAVFVTLYAWKNMFLTYFCHFVIMVAQ